MSIRILLVLIFYVYYTDGEYSEPGPKYRCPKIGSLSELALHPCRCVADSDNGLALHCENSNLASLSVGFSNVASLGDVVVDNLTISSCNIGNTIITNKIKIPYYVNVQCTLYLLSHT